MNLCGTCCVLGRPLAPFFPHPYFQFDSTTTTCTKCAGDVWCGDEQVWHATGHFSKALFDKCSSLLREARDLATLDGKPPGPPPASVAKGGTKTKASGKRGTKGKAG